MIVGHGNVTAFNGVIHKEGSIIGIHEFVTGAAWDHDIIANKPGFFVKLSYDIFQDMIDVAALTASRLWKRIIYREC